MIQHWDRLAGRVDRKSRETGREDNKLRLVSGSLSRSIHREWSPAEWREGIGGGSRETRSSQTGAEYMHAEI